MNRIKTLVAVILCFCSLQIAQAQVKFGVKGGLNITTYHLDNTHSKAYLYRGFYVGPSVKLSLPISGLGVESALLYEQKESDVKAQNSSNTHILRQKQVSLPLHARYSVGLGSVANVFIYAGPQFSYNLGNSYKTLKDDVATWNFSKTNLSVNAGLGVTMLKSFQLSVGYNKAIGKTGEVSFNDAIKKSIEGKADSWQVGMAVWF